MAKKLTDKQKSMLGSAATGLSSGIGLGTSLAQIDDTSGQEALIEGVGSAQFAGGDTNTLLSSFDANNMARTNYTADEIRGFTDGQLAGNILASTASGALSGAMKGGWVGALIEGGSNLIGGTIGALAGNAKAQKRAAELNSLAEENNRIYLNNFANAASNTQNKMFNKSLLNIAAEGGFLDGDPTDWDNTLSGRLISYTENRDSVGFNSATRRWYAPKGVGYDPNNRGMGVDINYLPEGVSLHTDSNGTYLTEEEERAARYAKLEEANNSYNQRLKYAQKVVGSTNVPSEYKKALVMDAIYNLGAGNVANVLFEDRELMNALLNGTDEEFRTYIQQYWDSNSSKVVKPRAERIKMQNVFLDAQKAYGGPLFNHGGDWSNGLTFINEGGTHEQNPLGGVPVGVDQEGTPNLVEEGEIIWNDYVFSNRLKPTKKQLETVGFDNKYEGYTFAKIVEDVQKASAENPLDKISTDTLNENLMYLMSMQEEIRMKKAAKQNNKFARGGKVNILNGNANSQSLLGLFPLDENIVVEDIPIEIEDVNIDTDYELPTPQYMHINDGKVGNISEYEFKKRLKDGTAIVGDKYKSKNKYPWQSNLRYASPLIHGVNLLTNLKKPDYSNADRIEAAARAIPGGSYTPLGNILDLQLIDQNTLVNPIIANANATSRALQQGATDPRASLLANNYLTNNAIGNALIQGIQANNDIKAQKAQFDLTRDQANSQMGLQALAMDQQRAQNILAATAQAGELRSQLDAARSQAIGESLTGIADDLGSIGRESSDRYLMEKLIGSDALRWVKDKDKPTSKNGGMLTRNRRRK